MPFPTLTQEEIHKMILDTATKLISNDIVNDFKASRYMYEKTGVSGIFLDMEQAASDAGHLVVACMLEARERETEVAALEAEEMAALDAFEEKEEAAEAAVAKAEMESEAQYVNSGLEALPCESPKSSSRTSASTRRSKPT